MSDWLDAMRNVVDRPRIGRWMQTYSGRKFYPLDPLPEEIFIVDVAHGLANTGRYGGHTTRFYSVAEHSVLVSLHVAPEYAREGLMHDASEAYLGDMIRPMKYQPEMVGFRRAEAYLESAIQTRFGLSCEPAAWSAVKEIDDRILVDEAEQIMAPPVDDWHRALGLTAVGALVTGLSPELAEFMFLQRFAELFPGWRA